MPSEVLVAIIGLLGSAIGTFGGIMATSRLTNYRIEQLESKVEKHNNLIERTYKLEESEEVLCEKIKVINHRINNLEDYHK